jgi:hypothetical protein
MPIVGTGSSQGKTVRWKTSGTSLASGSSYTLGVPTFTNDVIVFAYVNGSAGPTLTSSTTGITWTQYKTTGGSSPQPTMIIGVGATAGITSIVVSGTSAGGGGYVLAVISGRSASPVIATSQAVWTSTTGGTTGSLNLSSNVSPLVVGVTAQFGSVTLTSASNITGFPQIQGSNSVTRSIVLFTSEEPTSPSTQQVNVLWPNASTGGALCAGLARG